MAYDDYGAYVWCNNQRRTDKEDAPGFGKDESDYADLPAGTKIWAYLIEHQNNPNTTWPEAMHHGIMGDGEIRVICHKQGRPQIYEVTKNGYIKIEYCTEDTDLYQYDPIHFEYKGYKFDFKSSKPYYARMFTPEGDCWECEYDYGYGEEF